MKFTFKPHDGLASLFFEDEAPLRESCDLLHRLGVLPEWEAARTHDGEVILNSGPIMGLRYRIHFTGRGGGWLDIQSVQ